MGFVATVDPIRFGRRYFFDSSTKIFKYEKLCRVSGMTGSFLAMHRTTPPGTRLLIVGRPALVVTTRSVTGFLFAWIKNRHRQKLVIALK
jgi:hypothetical protein